MRRHGPSHCKNAACHIYSHRVKMSMVSSRAPHMVVMWVMPRAALDGVGLGGFVVVGLEVAVGAEVKLPWKVSPMVGRRTLPSTSQPLAEARGQARVDTLVGL